MALWNDAFSTRTTHFLELVLTEVSTDAGSNTSNVTATLQINPPSDSSSWNLYTTQNSYSLTFEGQTYTGSFTFDFRTNRATKVLKTVTKTVAHGTDGTGSASAYGSASSSTIGSASISTKSIGLSDFARVPSTPGIQSHTRTNNAGTVNVTSGTANFYGSGGYYQWMWSYDNANWNGPYNLDGSRNGSASVSNTSTVYVVTRAVDSEGISGWSNVYGTSVTAGVPTAPQAINATRTARNIAINITGSASNGGSTITGYKVQYNDGSGWSTAVSMSGTTYTYTNLPAAKTYTFRTFAENAVGDSAFTTTATGIYVAAGGKRWDGSTFSSTTTAKRWDGSAWTDITTAKRWTGLAWTDLS